MTVTIKKESYYDLFFVRYGEGFYDWFYADPTNTIDQIYECADELHFQKSLAAIEGKEIEFNMFPLKQQ